MPGEAQHSQGTIGLVRPTLTPQRVAPKVVAEDLAGSRRSERDCSWAEQDGWLGRETDEGGFVVGPPTGGSS